MKTLDDPQVQFQDLPAYTVTNDNPQPESSKEDAANAPQQPRVVDGDEGVNGENTTTVDWVDPTKQEKKKKRSKKPKSKRGKVLLIPGFAMLVADRVDQTYWFRGVLR